MRLLLDHHYSPGIATALRARGYDVVAADERGWKALPDDELLAACAREQRCLLTNDIGDFVRIARAWAAEYRHHAGLVFTSDRRYPREREAVGRLIRGLAGFMDERSDLDVLADDWHWL